MEPIAIHVLSHRHTAMYVLYSESIVFSKVVVFVFGKMGYGLDLGALSQN